MNMKEFDEGGWHVFEERTRKSFGRFQLDASRGLLRGLSGLTTTHEWHGTTCNISAIGAEAILTYEEGIVRCRVRIAWYVRFWPRNKILSDIKNTTMDVCGAVSLTNRTVFIVHGHNAERRRELQAILGGLGLQPIVLDEADSMGMTVIEKLDYYAHACAFAIVLMTPDDLGASSQAGRARQNVVLEIGWFMALLGRNRVLLLSSGGLEIPSDIYGIIYVEFKDSLREVEGTIQQRLRGAGMIA
jgi:hypothetical protein